MIELLKASIKIQRLNILVVLIILFIFFSAGTLLYGGKVNPKTYETIHGLDSIESTSTFSISNNTQLRVFYENFKNNNISAWEIDGYNCIGSLGWQDGSLVIGANFDKKGINEAAGAIRKMSVDIKKGPIFTVRLKAPEVVFYHIRFWGINSDGEVFPVWWETSPLDDRKGTGEWEEVSIPIDVFTRFAIKTENITALTEMRIIIDDAPEFDAIGEVGMMVDEYSFKEDAANVERIEQLTYGNGAFQALFLKLSNETLLGFPWNTQRISLSYEIEGNIGGIYRIYAINRTLDNYYICRGPFFTTGNTGISLDYYEIETYAMKEDLSDLIPYNVYGHIEEGLTLVFVSKDFDAINGFRRIEVKSIDLVYAIDGLKSNKDIDQQVARLAGSYSIFMVYIFLIGILPAISILVIHKLRQLKEYSFSKKSILLISIVGLLISFSLSIFTGHSEDMNVWTFHARSYYETGLVTLETWPTMPFFYYILLMSYFPYALARSFIVNDPIFLAHPSRMLESAFIKAPLILSGLVSFVFLFRIIQDRERNNRNSVFLASLYFLSFLNVFVSSVWGMYDGLAVALLLAGVYYGLVKDKYFVSILAFSLSGLTKIFGFVGFIPLLVKLIKKGKKRLLPFCLLVPVALGSIFYFPIIMSNGISSFFEIFLQMFLKGNTGLGLGSDISTIVAYHGILGIDLTERIYPYSMLLLMAIVTIYYFLQSRKPESDDLTEAVKFIGLSFMVFYLTSLRVFVQHYLWILPILILYSVHLRKNGLVSAAVFFSTVVTFLGPPSTATFGYFLFGVPYNIGSIFNGSDAQVVATSISFLIILLFIQIIKPSTGPTNTRKELVEFLVLLIQFSLILALLYMQYHNIISLSYFSVLVLNGIVILLSPASLACLKSIVRKLSGII